MKLEVSIEDYQVIRLALMERPAKDVYELIARLDTQVVQQNKLPMAKVGDSKGN